jgi:UDPglucose 6-dehydrogenase
VKGISVIGIGKLGLCTASCFADRGYRVIGVDVNQDTIAAVNEGRSPIYEPGLTELMSRCDGRLSATDNYKYAIQNSDVSFIIVPTPSQDDGGFSTAYVEAAARDIAFELRDKDSFHVVVITSTVLPGGTEEVVRPLLEAVSGKRCGVDFGLCYNPEFIALGSVIRDFMNPDMVLIGESDSRSGEIVADIYRKTCSSQPYIARMSPYNAELAKISLNAYVTMKISFANTLAELCEHIPDGNVDLVTGALGADSRIGQKYLSGALSYGGPCFPRDNKAFLSTARKLGCEARLSQATDEVNSDQVDRVVQKVVQKLGKDEDATVAILGLTYKSGTDVIEVSAAVEIARALSQQGRRVKVHDPAGMRNAEMLLGESVEYSDSIEQCLQGADICLVTTPWMEFKQLKPDFFISIMRRPVVLDCWRIYDREKFSDALDYLAVGLNSTKSARPVAAVEAALR